MDAQRPEDVSRELVTMLRRGDVDAVMDLYEPDALFADVDAVYVGSAEIRTAHERFVEAGLELTLRESATLRVGELALVHWSWSVSDGAGTTVEGSSAEVLRRQPDGSWKFVIDNSDGPEVIGLVR